jgi:hypothetical protein
LLTLPFKAMLLGRGRCNRRGKSGGPALLEPSLKVKRDTAHYENSGSSPRFQGPQRTRSHKGPFQKLTAGEHHDSGRAVGGGAGRRFMNHAVAMARLKAALIPMLQAGTPMRGVFEGILR